MSNKAAVLTGKEVPFAVENRDVPQPNDDEILVKNSAIAICPADFKQQDWGFAIDKYPTIIGSDVSGVIESAGSNITGFMKGDRVTGFADILWHRDSRSAAFQEYTILRQSTTAKIPDTLSFEEGATLPMAIATAGLGIFHELEIPRPPAKQDGAFLIWGGSSSVGTAVIQIVKQLGFTVYTVNSAKNNDYVKSLGASHCFDYNDPNVVQTITDALKASNLKLKYAYDAISEKETSPKTAEILSNVGGGRLIVLLPWPESAKTPGNVEVRSPFAASVGGPNADFGKWLFGEWLEKALVDKTFVPSPPVKKVEGGIEGLQTAVDLSRKGVSGVKLVVPL